MSEYLPPEIITLILRRLPVESAVKCTAVCKTWNALIKDRTFISTHLQAAAALQDDDLLLLHFYHGMRFVYHLHRDNAPFEEYKRLAPPPNRFGDYMFVGTCNGLICLTHVEEDSWNIILWNSSIRKHFVLPEPDLPLARECYFHYMLGFGFDSVSDDYKVLLILPDGDTRDMDDVLLFSLNRRSWTRLTESSPIHSFYDVMKTVFVKGALHYCPLSNMILGFNMSTEKFFVITIPEALVHFIPRMRLIKYEESIALVFWGNSPDDDQLELWVMKEYGVDSSWTKVLHSVDENRKLVFGTYLFDVFVVTKKGKAFLNVRREHGHHCELAMLDLNCLQQEHQKQQQQLQRLGVPINFPYLFFW